MSRKARPERDVTDPAEALRRRTQQWSKKIRVTPSVVRVQAMRRKWGSCSSKGTITLARELIDEPSRFQDYVIVHELLHLRVPNHGRLFKTLMNAYLPGWRRLARSHTKSGTLTEG